MSTCKVQLSFYFWFLSFDTRISSSNNRVIVLSPVEYLCHIYSFSAFAFNCSVGVGPV